MRLETQSPPRVGEAVLDGTTGVVIAIGAIHGLQREMPEGERLEPLRLCLGLRLREYELELVPVDQAEGLAARFANVKVCYCARFCSSGYGLMFVPSQ